jgi:hypothetical protein
MTDLTKITVKLLDNPDNPKLKMKYIGAVEYATPKLGKDGKIKTGFDENALDILAISDDKERKEIQNKIVKDRKELEKLLGVDLGPSSSFWDKFFVPLTDEEFILDTTNPMDRVTERFLIANCYVAPEKEDIYEKEEFQSCIFYMYRDADETSKAVKKKLES